MKRLTYLDIAKGIGILLVVIGHVYRMSDSAIIRYIYSFHVGMFYIISGILFNMTKPYNKRFYKVLWNKALTLLIPYAFFELFYDVIFCICGNPSDFFWVLRQGATLQHDYATWFLPILFLSEIILISIKKIIKNDFAISIVVLIMFILTLLSGISYQQESPLWPVYPFLRTTIAMGFMWFGNLISNYHEKIIRQKSSIAIIGILSIVCSYLNIRVSWLWMSYGNPMLFVASALLGSAFVLCVGYNIKHSTILEYLGQNTVVILGTHQSILMILRYVFGQEPRGLTDVIYMAITILIQFPLICFFNKYLPFLIGKHKKL